MASLLLAGVAGMPAHASAVGGTAGEFSVGDTGTAQYRIPLVLPPGTAGMTPALSLTYSSGSGDGLAGWGWHLSGLSAIHRCGATYAQNGQMRAITNTDSDRLCLDGNQLMLVSGTYLHAGAEYRTERETFARITQIGSGTSLYFKVEYKNGRIAWYGSTSNARPLADDASAVREWRVNKITDRAGNAILFTYQRDPGGALLPDDISYTKTTGASAYNAIHFTYEARPAAEIVSAYAAGSAVGREKRLTTITVKHGTTIARQYKLTYKSSLSPVTQHSRLASVQECGMGGTDCFAPVQFDWFNESTTLTAADYSIGEPWAARWADINGDGREDYYYWGGRVEEPNPDPYEEPIYHYTKMGYWLTGPDGNPAGGGDTAIAWPDTGDEATSSGTRAMLLDFDGDGDSEIIYPRDGGLYVARWNGTGFDEIALAAGGYSKVADVNGDGYDDLLQPFIDHVLVRLNQRTGDAQAFAADPVRIDFPDNENMTNVILDTAGNDPSSTADQQDGPPTVDDDKYFRQADFNGDGRTDLLMLTIKSYPVCDPTCKNLTSTNWFAVFSNFQAVGGGYYPPLDLGLTTEAGEFKFLTPLDINGDGLTDLAYYDKTAGHWWTRLSTGMGFAAPVNAGGGYYEDSQFQVTVADGNGDGRQDLFITVPVASDVTQPPGPEYVWQVKYSTGGTLGAPAAHSLDYDQSQTFKIPPTLRSVDINGDGVREILLHRTLNRRGDSADGFGAPADQLKKITDSFGNITTISYRPLADSAIYSATPQPAVTDAYAYHPKRFVVSEYSAPDGAGGTFTVNYQYTGGARDRYGRGFLGFAKRQVTDSRTDATVTTTYRQDFPYTGLPKQKDLRDAQGDLISRTTITPAQKTFGSGAEQRVLAYPQTTVEKSYGVGGTQDGQLLKTVTTQISNLDAYGNPGTTTVTTTGDGQTFTTQKTIGYSNTASTWCLGQVTHNTVTQTLPGQTPTVIQESSALIDTNNCRPTQQTRIAVDPVYGDLSLTTTYGYDDWGNVSSTTVSGAGVTPRTTTTDYAYYSGRFPRTATNAAGHQTTFTWDAVLGLQTAVTDPNGLTTVTTYDPFGRPATQTAPDGTATTFTYAWCTSGCGVSNGEYRLTQTRDTGAHSETVFDAFGRERRSGARGLNGVWSYTVTDYDNQSRVARQSLPYRSGDTVYWTTFAYDLLGRQTTATQPYNPATGAGGGQTTTAYNGFVTTVTDANGHSSAKTVNAIGQTVQMEDALNNITRYQYDAAGHLITTINDTTPSDVIISMGYDQAGNKRVMDDPDMGHWEYTYNAYGELTAQTDAKGQITTLAYDKLGRLISRTDGAGSANALTSTWTWDTAAHGIGKLASVTQSNGYAEHYSYDSLSRVTDVMTTVDDTDYTVSTTYDAFSRVATVTYPQSVATSNSPVNAIAHASTGSAVAGTTITLDGSDSTDADSYQTLSYQWSQTAGPAVTISGASSATASLTPTVAGDYAFSLSVSDGVMTATDTVSIAISPTTPGPLSVSDGATSTDGAYSLNWSAPAQGFGAGSDYRLEEDGDPAFGSPSLLYQGTATTTNVSGKGNGPWNYRVRACEGDNCSPAQTASVQVTLPPDVPGTPVISPATSTTGGYTVAWSAPVVGEYNSYQLEEALGADFSGGVASSDSLPPTSTQKAYTGRGNGQYSYRVKACNNGVCSAPSGEATATVTLPPGVPASISVPASDSDYNGDYSISWGTATGTVTAYQLYEADNSSFTNATQVYSGTATSRAISNQGDGTYYYRVRACNQSACSAFRTGGNGISVVNEPGAPASITVPTSDTDHNGDYTISWGTASGTVTAYQLYEADNSSFTGAVQVYSGTATSRAISNQDDGTYYYRVRACNGGVCSSWRTGGNGISVVNEPGVPASITVPTSDTDHNGDYTISWGTASGTVTAYQLYEATNSSFTGAVQVYAGTATSRAITDQDDGTYYYRVRACNGSVCSTWRTGGNSIDVINKPGVPASITVPTSDTDHNGDYTISWGTASGNVTAYQLYEATNSSFSGQVQVYSGTATSRGLTGRSDGNYYYRVRACNGSVCSSWRTGGNAINVINQPGVPASISVPSSDTGYDGDYTVSWGAASGTVTAYELYEARNSSNFSGQSRVYNGSGQSKALTDRTDGTYYYRVRACNGGVCSGWRTGGNSLTVYRMPGTPSSVTADFTPTFDGAGTVTVTWPAASGTVTQYTLQEAYRSSIYNSWGAWNTVQSSTARSWSDDKFPPGIFKYRVRACNGPACSSYVTSGEVAVMFEDDPMCPPKCDPGVMAEPQTKLDAPQLATTDPAGGLARSVSFAPFAKGGRRAAPGGFIATTMPSASQAVQPITLPAATAQHAAYTPRAASDSVAPFAKGGRPERAGGFAATAQHAAYTPHTATSQGPSTAPRTGFRLMPPGRPAPAARTGEAWGAGDWVTARDPLAAFAPRYASFGSSAKTGTGFTASFWQEKVSGDGSGYRFTVEYSYDAYGHLTNVHNAQEQSLVYWQASAADAWGHVTQAQLGNGLRTQRTYDPATGRLMSITTGSAATPTSIQNLAYQWDAIGNLTQRQDLNRSLTEAFTYDELNRLTQTALNSLVTQALSYDALGNIQQKTVNSTTTAYVYDLAAGPHALTALQNASGVITASYSYDANGNITNGGGRTLTWNAANYPIAITQGSHTTAFTYGPDRQRVTQTETQSGTLIQTTVSIGALFEQSTTATGDITYRHFIRAGSQTVAIHTRTSAYTQSTTYIHRDHLGSVSAITNEDGDVMAHLSFGAFGNRRNPETWQGSAANPTPGTTDRGYTGHKMLDGVGLIHMNGRVYDPGIGRFISADPIIQAPYNSQSFNRYSYVWNNPLSAIDPSGFVMNWDSDSDDLGTVQVLGDPISQCNAECQYVMGSWARTWLSAYFQQALRQGRDYVEIRTETGEILRIDNIDLYGKDEFVTDAITSQIMMYLPSTFASKYAQQQTRMQAVKYMYQSSLRNADGGKTVVSSSVLLARLNVLNSRSSGVDMANMNNWGGWPSMFELSGDAEVATQAMLAITGFAFGATEVYFLARGSIAAAQIVGRAALIGNLASLAVKPSWTDAGFIAASIVMGPFVTKMAQQGYHDAAAYLTAHILLTENMVSAANAEASP